VFNAGKDIEAMKHLTLHRIASLLYRFCCPALGRGIVPGLSVPGTGRLPAAKEQKTRKQFKDKCV
jgi:hypothetical protein